MVRSLSKRLGVALVCMGFLSGFLGIVAPAAGAAHVEPTVYDSQDHNDPFFHNPSCADVAANVGAGPWIEFKVNSGATNGVKSDGTLSVTISNAAANGFTWQSNIDVDAVIVKAGDAANVYVYDPEESGPDAVETPGKQSVSHYTFCYDLEGEISIDKTPDAGTVNQGDAMSFTIVVTAGGDADSENVTVTDDLPNGFDWSITSQTGSACVLDASDDLTCTIGTMTSGSTYSVTVSADTDEAECATYNNTADVESDNDEDSDDGAVTVENCITPTPSIEIEKTPDGGSVAQGGTMSFTIEVTAAGGVDSTDVSVSDDLPNGFDWSITSQTATACALDASDDLTCTIGTMTSGSTYSVTVSASTAGKACQTYNNTASVESDNDSDSDTGDVTVTGCDGAPPIVPVVTPTPEVGALTLSKSVVNGVGGESFEFLVNCSGSSQIVTLGDGDSTTIGNLPVGTSCTVTEQAPEDTEVATWSTTITDSDGNNDGTVIIDTNGESVSFTNTRTEVAGEVIERPPAPAPQPQPPAPAPAPEVIAAQEERALPRTGVETSDFMLFAGLALLLGGLLLGWGEAAERRFARRTA